MVWLMDLAGIGILVWLSIEDMKTYKISMAGILGFAGAGLLRSILYAHQIPWIAWVTCLVIFCIGFLIGRLFHGAMGKGDIFLISLLPLWKNGEHILYTILIAFSCASLYMLIRYGWKEKKRRFAFVPWLTFGVGAEWVFQWIMGRVAG